MRHSLGVLLSVALCTCMRCTSSSTALRARSARGRQLQQHGTRSSKANSAALLLELLPELQYESKMGLQLMDTQTKWCSSVQSHRQKMATKLRQQLGEAKAEQQQLDTEERRLAGEREMANTTESQEEALSKESKSLASIAAKTYLGERRQLDQSLDAASTAMRLLRLRLNSKNSDGNKDPATSLDGLGRLSETSAAARTLLEGAESGNTGVEELMQDLVALDSELIQDAANADQDHLAVSEKLRAAQERVTSSILQAQSQAAIAKMGLAERHRRHARVDSEALSTSDLLQAVEASDAAVSSDCHSEEEQSKKAAGLLAAEISAVQTMLGRLPSASWASAPASWTSAPNFLQVAPALPRSRPALESAVDSRFGIALNALANLSHSFPEKSAWYEEAAQQLSLTASADGSSAAVVASTPAVKDNEHAEDSDDDATNPLKDIQQFAASGSVNGWLAARSKGESMTPGEPMTAHDAGRVQDTYSSLLARVLATEQVASNRSAWCTVVSKSTAADAAALEYASRQADAKLQFARNEISDCKLKSKYDLEQRETIEKQLAEIHGLASQATQDREAFIRTLGTRSKQLSALVADLDQETAAEDQEMAKGVSTLLRSIDRHRALLQQGQSSIYSSAADQANKRIYNILATRAKNTKSRLLQRESEARSLGALSRARARALSSFGGDGHGVAAAAIARLCESNELPSLKQQEQALRNLLSDSAATTS